jgi:hypothetical protein
MLCLAAVDLSGCSRRMLPLCTLILVSMDGRSARCRLNHTPRGRRSTPAVHNDSTIFEKTA